jgi:small subunit ribosomal protein S7
MRKSRPKKRILLPDPKYKDPYVTRFVNNLMYSGKKNLAFTIFYDSLEIIGDKFKSEGKTPALDNVTPQVEVKARRVGGATFQVPMEIRADRKVSISMKNMVSFARKRTGHSMAERLAAELMAAYKLEGGAYKKKEDTHRMAEANKAFAHFRF